MKHVHEIPSQLIPVGSYVTHDSQFRGDQTPAGYEAETIEECFALCVAAQPHVIAVVDGSQVITYSDLAMRAERLSCELVNAGVCKGDFVALVLERGVDLIVAMLAILRAGAAYVPIDPRYPESRRDLIRDDCGAVAAVVNDGSGVMVRQLYPSRRSSAPAGTGRLAYVMYTSGSTGKPKGVMVTHENLLRLFGSTRDEFCFSAADVWCGFHSPSFDLSGWEIWGALLHGGRYVVTPGDIARNPVSFADLLHTEKVTQLIQTPSAFRNLMPVLLSRGCPPSLRTIVFCGEKLDFQALRPWARQFGLQRPSLVNMFGPTETTIVATYYHITDSSMQDDAPNFIGSPIRNLQLRIILPDGSEAPPGTPGLIHVGGSGVSAGYLGAAALTAKHFYTAPDAQGIILRWYNSGDIGMQIGANEFAYISRADRQLKIRGHRIEPAEIEEALRACPDVIDCIVTSADFADNDHRLVACVIVTEASLRDRAETELRLRTSLAAKLPNHMLASNYFLSRQFPLNENGKLDISTCIRKHEADHVSSSDGDGSMKSLVRNIWTKILVCDQIGDDDDFFNLGGTSITLVKMLSEIYAICGTKLILDILDTDVTVNIVVQAIHEHLASDAENQSPVKMA